MLNSERCFLFFNLSPLNSLYCRCHPCCHPHLLDLQGATDARGHRASQQIQAITFAAHVHVLGDLFKPVLVETSEWLFSGCKSSGSQNCDDLSISNCHTSGSLSVWDRYIFSSDLIFSLFSSLLRLAQSESLQDVQE